MLKRIFLLILILVCSIFASTKVIDLDSTTIESATSSILSSFNTLFQILNNYVVTIGFPIVFVVLYRMNSKHVQILNSQIEIQKLLTYDNALSELSSQKKLYTIEIEKAKKEISIKSMEQKSLYTKIQKKSIEINKMQEKLKSVEHEEQFYYKVKDYGPSDKVEEINLKTRSFMGKIDFSASNFRENVLMPCSNFNGLVDFKCCTFNRINFKESLFFKSLILDNCDIRKVSLVNTDMRGVDLSRIKYDKTTIFPKL